RRNSTALLSMVQAVYGRNAGHPPLGSASERLARPGSAAVPIPVSKPQPIPASHVLNRRAHVTGMVRGISPEQAWVACSSPSEGGGGAPQRSRASARGPPTLIFPCDFFWVLKMLDRAAIIALIGRIRRAMPRNADVIADANSARQLPRAERPRASP